VFALKSSVTARLSVQGESIMEKPLMRQFHKYGSVVIGGNILIIFLICSLAGYVFGSMRIFAVTGALMSEEREYFTRRTDGAGPPRQYRLCASSYHNPAGQHRHACEY
jgi:hypothetical protein